MRLSYDDRKLMELSNLPGPGSYARVGHGVIDEHSVAQLNRKLINEQKKAQENSKKIKDAV